MVFNNNSGTGDNLWSTATNWVGNTVPSAAADVEIQANVTYDESNVYTSSPKAYNNVTVANGVTITLNSGSDLCFQRGISCTSAGSYTVTGAGNLVNYKPTQYYSISRMNLEGNFRIFNDVAIALGTEYVSIVNIKDGGVFTLDINAGSTPVEIDNSVVIEAGGAMYVENQDAAINIGRSGGSGSLTVQAGGTLGASTSQSVTVNFNNSSSALVFESGSNFVENGSVWSFTTSNATSPLPKPEFRYTIEGQGANTALWHQFALPFALTATTEFSSDIPYNTTSGQENLFKWNSGNDGTEWTGWEAYTSSTLAAGDIYTVYAGGSNFPYSGNSFLGLSDDINWAGRSYSATHSNSTALYYNPGTGGGGNTNNQGWNPIPNPYPAHLKVSSIISELTSKSFSYKAVHIWDPSANGYIAYVDGGGSIISSTDGGTASAGTYDQLVPPGRFFWVKSYGAISIDVTAAMRAAPSDFTTPINMLHGLKSQAEYLRLELNNGSHKSHITYIDRPQFSADTVGKSDAYALPSFDASIPRWYEVLPDNNASELCINSLDLQQFGSRSISVETSKSENLSIAIDTSTLSGLNHLYLLDHKLNINWDLVQGPYVFTHNENDVKNRFSLAVDVSSIGIETLDKLNIAAHFQDRNLRMKFPKSDVYTLRVYTITGTPVFESTQKIDGELTWNQAMDLPHGIYIIHIQAESESATFTQKLIK
ncbi:MAG: hypothetical protein SchgKO_05630 [Schleiferiaceae bacterium]